ncbi:MAG: 30S ribosomal protein S10 [Candidatus Micrarchaeota archaeon]|nr:MAG: 30S ribosomal protein S10 [Candidatus Micrarchaeota archaeon]
MRAFIKLASTDYKAIYSIANNIKNIAASFKLKFSGPIPFPTKVIKHTTRRAPNGDGSKTYEYWIMKIHKIMIVIDGDEQAFRQILRIPVPDNVQIEINLSS